METNLALLADIGPQLPAQRAVIQGGRLWVSDMEVLRDATSSTAAATTAPVQATTSVMILLVEDDGPLRSALAHAMIGVGFDVQCAIEAREAVAVLRETPVAAVVADYHLPDRTGVWVLNNAAKAYPHSFRVLISGDPLVDRARLTAHGVCHVGLQKPIDPGRVADLLVGAGVATG